ncbi:MAG: hypothetical protein Q8938_15095 [Bacteroidota bacterium]|nr:hypothetical protein [Bacteroidota bacterium]
MMKIIKYLLPVVLAFSLTGCLDIYETIEVKPNGSGQFSMDMDMSQMVDLMQTYMSKEDLAKKGMDKMDTTIRMRDIVDTVQSIPLDKRKILDPGTLHIQLDMDAKLFKTHMLFPYSSQADLQKLYSVMSDGSLGTAQLFKKMDSPSGTENNVQTDGPSPDLNQFNGVYDFTSRDGVIEKRLNAERWKALQDNPQMAQMRQASTMGVEISYTTIIKLPRPVKKVDTPLAKLSDDKKTVTIKYNLMDIFDHPDQFGYKVEY